MRKELAIGLLAGAASALGSGSARADERIPGALDEVIKRPVVKYRTLTRDETIGRVECKAGTDAGFDGRGRLMFCRTARAVVLDGVPVAAGANTMFHLNGRVYQTDLARPHRFKLADGRTVPCAAKNAGFYDDGRLFTCELAELLGPDVPARVGEGISFRPDGRLQGARLDRPLQITGTTFESGTYIFWSASGAVGGGLTLVPARVAGLSVRGSFDLYPDGKPRRLELEDAARVQGHDFPRGAYLEFRPDGTLERARYEERHGFLVHAVEWHDTATVTYDRSGAETSRKVEHWQESHIPHPIPPEQRRPKPR